MSTTPPSDTANPLDEPVRRRPETMSTTPPSDTANPLDEPVRRRSETMSTTPPSDTANPLDDVDFALRNDIRRLGNQLGRALVRQHGPELLQQVEQVRGLSMDLRRRTDERRREHSTALEVLLAGVDIQDAGLLARAFTVYFHLANTAEQVHRTDDLAEKLGSASHRFAETVERLQRDGFSDDEISETVNRMQLRPVFTAHPTEASRRSILYKLTEIADLIEQRSSAGTDEAARRRADRRVDELIDAIWQTDELRHERPTPMDEAPFHPALPHRDNRRRGAGTA